MKELILIGAHCPDDDREELLWKLVNQLQKVRDNFDILICSHLIIPEYISKKVDYVFYDKNNELIYDTKYLNQPWFSPVEGMTILSTLISDSSTYLAVYRLLMSGLGIAKIYGYEKTHYIEYDTDFEDTEELQIHSKLLDEYDLVSIIKEEENFSQFNLDCPIGNFYSFKMNSLDDSFLTYRKELLLNILEKSLSKTNEKVTHDLFLWKNKKIKYRDYYRDISQKNLYGLSRLTIRDEMNYWTVPYYDCKKEILSVVAWNNKDEDPIDVVFLINDKQVIRFNQIKKYEWSIFDVSRIEDVNKITILVNGKLKNNITFDESYREIFKKTNYAYYTTNK
jgi:hypothetical protein